MDLSGANLFGTTLISANLTGANLEGAHLRYATLTGADLRDADLRDTVGLTQEQIDKAYIDETTKLPSHLKREPRQTPVAPGKNL